jgi:pyruvate dehydrogenase E2 component (dihydrolipoyllysine-residue acetyltransferase)
MPTPVLMPQMGESIAEGTIVRWIKKVGEAVDRDEPLFEISTDKVDAEIPAPATGVLTEIKVKEGETVAVNSVVATIGAASEVSKQESLSSTAPPAAPSLDAVVERDVDVAPAKPAATPRKTNGRTATKPTEDDSRKQRSSPLVRRIARDNDVDISQIHGSGLGGRVTKNDILDYIDSGSGTRDSGRGIRDSGLETRDPGLGTRDAGLGTRDAGLGTRDAGLGTRDSGVPHLQSRVEIKPLSVMRKKIAEHMVMSRRTSAHVHSVFHVNFSTVERIRQQKKAEYEQLGTKLTYIAFIAKAVVSALRRFPIVNASLDGDNVIYKKDINLGIAVALESGLIVPVIRHADEKNLLGLSRAIADIATRARSKQLKPEEVHDGTFTITNPGQFGSQFGMPIINQPQVAILGVGTIEKRPIVIDDAIAIRTMAYLTLGYDHRLVDGATGDQFMAEVKQQLENFDAT